MVFKSGYFQNSFCEGFLLFFNYCDAKANVSTNAVIWLVDIAVSGSLPNIILKNSSALTGIPSAPQVRYAFLAIPVRVLEMLRYFQEVIYSEEQMLMLHNIRLFERRT